MSLTVLASSIRPHQAKMCPGICRQWRPRSAFASTVWSGQLTESLDSVECISGKQMPGWLFMHMWDESEPVYFAQARRHNFAWHSPVNSKDRLGWLQINLYHSLGIFSRRQIDDIFLIFSRKQDLTFHANCLLRRQFAWIVKSCVLGKIRKIFQNVICWKFYPEC